jgi:hypothetical protein
VLKNYFTDDLVISKPLSALAKFKTNCKFTYTQVKVVREKIMELKYILNQKEKLLSKISLGNLDEDFFREVIKESDVFNMLSEDLKTPSGEVNVKQEVIELGKVRGLDLDEEED